MNLYVDIDGTICLTPDTLPDKYSHSKPIPERIAEVNKLYREGHHITYWTARGSASGLDLRDLTIQQLTAWGCLYHELKMGKPSYDLYIDDKSQNVNTFWPLQNDRRKTRKEKAIFVPKGWGHEIIFVNNKNYCGKILHFKKASKFSMHFHMKKQETWFVQSGRFEFHWIDTTDASIHTEILEEGDVITNFPGEPHQIHCLIEGDIFEVSTEHFDSDSYRVMKGDSQGQT